MSNVTTAVPPGLLAALLLVSCGGGQSTDDFIDRPGKSAERPCPEQRSPLPDDDPEVAAARAQLAATHVIEGRWGQASPLLEHMPADVAVRGELVLEPGAGRAMRLTGCGFALELPIRVVLRTDDGALNESFDGTARFADDGAGSMTVDGSPSPRLAHVQAKLELDRLQGGLRWDDDGEWTLQRALLRAEVTPFGSRGTLHGQIERRVPLELGPNESATSPAPVELLRWPAGEGCDDPEADASPSLFMVSSAASAELTAAIEEVQQATFPAQYGDGTMTRVSVGIELSGPTCSADALSLSGVATLKTEDGRLDLSVPIRIDPSFALLHFNNRTDVPWAFPPAQLSEQIGHIDLELDALAHVGIEAWFDKTPEPQGWVKVLGYGAGDCLLCGAGEGCSECSWERRMELLSLFIGAQIGRQ